MGIMSGIKLELSNNDNQLAISEHPAMERINRALQEYGHFLRKTRSNSPLRMSLGTYYLVDSCKHYIEGTDHLDELARRLGVLERGEFVSVA
jgi:hypothetical protein